LGAALAVRGDLEGEKGGHMSFDSFGAQPPGAVPVDVYTPAYRVSGTTRTRFQRVADILNQLPTAHLVVDDATITEYAAPSTAMKAGQVLIALERIVLMVTRSDASGGAGDMRIPKRAVRADLLVPPFRVSGAVHVPHGSRPVDGLLNAADRFLAMTSVTVGCPQYPKFAGTFEVVAMQRSLAHLIVASDDERPDELLADVLDETTAHDWLQRDAGIASER
jgi:hypothetical protein